MKANKEITKKSRVKRGLCGQIKLVSTVMFLCFLLTLLSSCKRFKEKQNDNVTHLLNWVVKHPMLPTEAKERAHTALSKWNNKKIEKGPILICSWLGHPIGTDDIYLNLVIYDEDNDVLGIGIEESYLVNDSQTENRRDEYPIYIHADDAPGILVDTLPIKVRSICNRYNPLPDQTRFWQEYNASLESSESIPNNLLKIPNREPNKVGSWLKQWKVYLDVESMKPIPNIYVSIPEPNNVDVWIWVYDRTGHKSEPVRLLNFLKEEYLK
jgi:hypothetical protein